MWICMHKTLFFPSCKYTHGIILRNASFLAHTTHYNVFEIVGTPGQPITIGHKFKVLIGNYFKETYRFMTAT